MGVKDYDLNPDNNTQINGINIAEGCPPSGINDAIRQMMADVKADKVAQDSATATAQSAADAAQSAADAAQSAADSNVKTVNGNAPDAAGNVVLKAIITETWSSGTSWYRKWSDGWIEQGGFIATTSSSKESAVTFSIPYSDTKYTLVFGGIGIGSDVVMNQRDLGEYASPTGHKSVSGFSVYTRPTISRNWYACGY